MSPIPFHLHSRWHLQLLNCLGFLLLMASALQAHAKNYASGLVIYLTPGDTLEMARASLYRTFNHSQPRSSFDIGAATPLVLENSVILQQFDLRFIFYSNIRDAEERSSLANFSTTLQTLIQKHPKTQPVCNSLVELIQSYLSRYDRGEVRVNGQWEPLADYQKRVAASEAAHMEAQALANLQMQQAQTLLNHLNASYKANVASLIQKDYEHYQNDVVRFLQRRQGSEIGFCPMDPGLYERSRLIPAPPGTDEAGIYSSDAQYGPAVIWVSKDQKIVSMMVGISILTDSESARLTNEQEFAQARNFFDRIEKDLLNFLPTFLAANKIERVLRKPQSVKSVVTSKTEIDVQVKPPQMLTNGETLQHVILYLF